MLEVNKKAATKFGIDTKLIEKKVNTQKNIEILGNDLTFIGVRERDRTDFLLLIWSGIYEDIRSKH